MMKPEFVYTIIYFFIGIYITHIYSKERYGNLLNDESQVESEMLCIYFTFICILWPVYLLRYLYLKYKKK
jgi:hypothetical protein